MNYLFLFFLIECLFFVLGNFNNGDVDGDGSVYGLMYYFVCYDGYVF